MKFPETEKEWLDFLRLIPEVESFATSKAVEYLRALKIRVGHEPYTSLESYSISRHSEYGNPIPAFYLNSYASGETVNDIIPFRVLWDVDGAVQEQKDYEIWAANKQKEYEAIENETVRKEREAYELKEYRRLKKKFEAKNEKV